MKNTIEVFTGSVTEIKLGDTFMYKSHIWEVVTKPITDAFTVLFKAMDTEGIEKEFKVGKEVFFNT